MPYLCLQSATVRAGTWYVPGIVAAALLLAGCAGQGADMANALAPGQPQAETTASIETKATAAVDRSKVAEAAKSLTAAATPGSNAYKIGPQDVLDISVYQVPDLQRTVQVAESGTVNLPLVGDVQAVGLTAQQVEQDVAKRLGAKYLQSPQVTVSVKEFNSQRVTVDGAVAKPGVYPIRGRSSLLQIISTAGGLTELSDDSNVVARPARLAPPPPSTMPPSAPAPPRTPSCCKATWWL
jgi:polysaccharide biosynthesis/export protein